MQKSNLREQLAKLDAKLEREIRDLHYSRLEQQRVKLVAQIQKTCRHDRIGQHKQFAPRVCLDCGKIVSNNAAPTAYLTLADFINLRDLNLSYAAVIRLDAVK